jgi:hypothetical protein
MNITQRSIKVRDLVADYSEHPEDGVVGLGGRLDIRPAYQREFVYKDKQRNAVIETARRGFPLNVMYWAVREDGTFEVIDGQQRTISLAQYAMGSFSVASANGDPLYFDNLTPAERDAFLDYELTVYECSGTDREKLEWFETINIAGETLTPQELRNAVYSGPWLADAKKYFSKNHCAAAREAGEYVPGSTIRQEVLQKAIAWHSVSQGGGTNDEAIRAYMAARQNRPAATDLWNYFRSVIDWVKATFPKYRKEMKGIDWGALYDTFHADTSLDPVALEVEISRLMSDDEVGKKSGVYAYLLTGEDKHLNLRAFSDNQKREAYERQNGTCPVCSKHFEFAQMHGDHITPWHAGGKTDAANCQMLCRDDNLRKGGQQ